jgi:uncharacterized protein (TIGR02246 family)
MTLVSGSDERRDTRNDADAVRNTVARYGHLCDDGRFEEFAELFAEDAEFVVPGRTAKGRAAIQAFMEAAQPPERRGKHLCAAPAVDLDGDTATAVTDFAFLAPAEGGFAVTSAGRYHDRLVRAAPGGANAWVFAERRIELLRPPSA